MRRLVLINILATVILLSCAMHYASGQEIIGDAVFFEEVATGRTLRLKVEYSKDFTFAQQLINVFDELAYLDDPRIIDIFCRNKITVYQASRDIIGAKCH